MKTVKTPDVTREAYSFADDLNLHTPKAVAWAKNWVSHNKGKLLSLRGELTLRIENNEKLFLKTTRDMLKDGLSINCECRETVYKEMSIAGNGKLMLAS